MSEPRFQQMSPHADADDPAPQMLPRGEQGEPGERRAMPVPARPLPPAALGVGGVAQLADPRRAFPDKLTVFFDHGPCCGWNQGQVHFREVWNLSKHIFTGRPWRFLGSLLLGTLIVIIGIAIALNIERSGESAAKHRGPALGAFLVLQAMTVALMPLLTGATSVCLAVLRGSTEHLAGPWSATFLKFDWRYVQLLLWVRYWAYCAFAADWAIGDTDGGRTFSGFCSLLNAFWSWFALLALPIALDREELTPYQCVIASIRMSQINWAYLLGNIVYGLALLVVGALALVVGVAPAICMIIIGYSVLYARICGLYYGEIDPAAVAAFQRMQYGQQQQQQQQLEVLPIGAEPAGYGQPHPVMAAAEPGSDASVSGHYA